MDRDTLSQEEMWDSLNEELWDRRMEMTEMKIVIAKLRKEISGLQYVVNKLEQEAKEWKLRLQDPAPISLLNGIKWN